MISTLEILVHELNRHIVSGDTSHGMELYIAAGLCMQENEDEPRVGKTNCLRRETLNREKATYIKSTLRSQAIDYKHQVVFCELEFFYNKGRE
jgi:hypothetical protein